MKPSPDMNLNHNYPNATKALFLVFRCRKKHMPAFRNGSNKKIGADEEEKQKDKQGVSNIMFEKKK